MNTENIYDVIVIGAGPAGMMAAGQAAQNGASVLLLEKMNTPGKKLLITGKGRCNITTSDESHNSIIENFGRNGKFLFSSLSKFDNNDVIEFFENLGLPTVEERGRRIFPKSGKASDVLQALMRFLKNNKVEILKDVNIKKYDIENNRIISIQLDDSVVTGKSFILCTGGLSYSSTGSTGDGYTWLREFGHNIIEPEPSLVPIRIKESWIKEVAGLSLRNVKIGLSYNIKKISDGFGEAVFIKDGIDGPIVLDLSKKVGQLLKDRKNNDPIKLYIDFKPALEEKTLDARILRDFEEIKNKTFQNSLDKLLPKKIIPVFIKLSGIDPNKKINVITKEERKTILGLLKGLELTVTGIYGYKRAIVTAGGVDLKEIDSKTMKSKILDNLFVAGEILDLDGPTGGYNLQVCWSTGFVAGCSAAEYVEDEM